MRTRRRKYTWRGGNGKYTWRGGSNGEAGMANDFMSTAICPAATAMSLSPFLRLSDILHSLNQTDILRAGDREAGWRRRGGWRAEKRRRAAWRAGATETRHRGRGDDRAGIGGPRRKIAVYGPFLGHLDGMALHSIFRYSPAILPPNPIFPRHPSSPFPAARYSPAMLPPDPIFPRQPGSGAVAAPSTV